MSASIMFLSNPSRFPALDAKNFQVPSKWTCIVPIRILFPWVSSPIVTTLFLSLGSLVAGKWALESLGYQRKFCLKKEKKRKEKKRAGLILNTPKYDPWVLEEEESDNAFLISGR